MRAFAASSRLLSYWLSRQQLDVVFHPPTFDVGGVCEQTPRLVSQPLVWFRSFTSSLLHDLVQSPAVTSHSGTTGRMQYCLSQLVKQMYGINLAKRSSQALVHFVIATVQQFADPETAGLPMNSNKRISGLCEDQLFIVLQLFAILPF